MKKITYLLLIAIFASCGSSNDNKQNNVENQIQTEVAENRKKLGGIYYWSYRKYNG